MLRCHKPLVVVVNECLMDNHQTELADALRSEEYLLSCCPEQLIQTLRQVPVTRFRPFPEPKGDSFKLLMDQFLFSDRN